MENRDKRELTSFRFKTDRGKTFFFDIKENDNGRFVKITESRPKVGEQNSYIRNFMTIPEAFLGEFIDNLENSKKYLTENLKDEG
ncbi:MAG: hypothetical protein JXJ19_10050 [Elusimicrobia bacterium]|nr:hypothetical protein [Elusimicrobiota bacterium]